MCVVDHLEMVNVHDQQAKLTTVPTTAADFTGKNVFEVAAVVSLRQRVMRHHFEDCFVIRRLDVVGCEKLEDVMSDPDLVTGFQNLLGDPLVVHICPVHAVLIDDHALTIDPFEHRVPPRRKIVGQFIIARDVSAKQHLILVQRNQTSRYDSGIDLHQAGVFRSRRLRSTEHHFCRVGFEIQNGDGVSHQCIRVLKGSHLSQRKLRRGFRSSTGKMLTFGNNERDRIIVSVAQFEWRLGRKILDDHSVSSDSQCVYHKQLIRIPGKKFDFMNRPHAPQNLPEPTTHTLEGWHCLHIYYQFERGVISHLSPEQIAAGSQQFQKILDPSGALAPERLQAFVVSGHRADFGLMMLDNDPLKIDRIHQELLACPLGPALTPTYSFVSITEVSEYVPTVEQYAEKLRQTGTSVDDPAYAAKVSAYEQRLPMMNKQRLYPDFPDWPVHCFYPMNKIRDPQANWFTLPASERSALMAEHATSGIKFAGRVSQLITASTGFDDWEWGVTLWSRTPEYIKEIVYTMRFDQASARYAAFGPFYIGYVMSAEKILRHVRILRD